jgi:Ran GTPase-activating protein (RanGAP) involved in mRNA processing and transport
VVADFLKVYKPPNDRNPFGVEILELPDNDITEKGALYLGRVLTHNETVKTLNLDFNPIGDEGAAALGDGLKWNSTLERLSLKYCNIGPIGGECVGKLIVRSSSVRELFLRGNQIGPHGVIHVSRALSKNAYLVKLDLADTGFGIDLEAIETLRDGIESNDSLETVDLSMNSMVPTGVQLLLEMLKAKPKLTQFDISERMSEAVFKDVLDTIANNVKLMKKKKKKGGAKKAAAPANAAASPPGSPA